MAMDERLVIPLLVLIVVIFSAGILAVIWHSIQLRKNTPPAAGASARRPEAPDNDAPNYIDLEMRDEEGSHVASAPPRKRKSYLPTLLRPTRPDEKLPLPMRLTREAFVLIIGTSTLLVLLVFALSQQFWPDIQLWLREDQFVVLVAPFEDDGGGETGAAVANQLAQLLTGDEAPPVPLTVLQADHAPTSAADALQMAEAHAADMVLWGSVGVGETLNRPALQPRLTYAPTGQYAPYAWEGYGGRFVLPATYELSRQPMNGRVVLPPLLTALANYHNGRADVAYSQLGTLLNTYPLAPTLPHMLRGNVLWARGNFADAAAEYRLALAAPGDATLPLTSNLWTILLDGNDPTAPAVLNDLVALAANGTEHQHMLQPLHYNLGLLALREGRLNDAVEELEQALALNPPGVPVTPLLLDLARVYRQQGRLQQAADLALQADSQRFKDVEQVPGDMQDILSRHLEAAMLEQKALISLSRLATAAEPLLWALEVTPPIQAAELEHSGERLERAIRLNEERLATWQQRAAAQAAQQQLEQTSGGEAESLLLVANGQTSRTAANLERQRYYHALQLIEMERAARAQRGGESLLSSILGTNAPVEQALRLLDGMVVDTPDDIPLLLAHARALRVRDESEQDRLQADERYDQVLAIAPARPEGPYGKGMLALQRGDSGLARLRFDEALALDAGFFPARMQLVDLARAEGDLSTALVHLRVLAQQQNRPHIRLELASVLRRSGPDYYAEAREVLQPLLAANHPAALTEAARIARDAGDPEQAEELLRQARAIGEQRPRHQRQAPAEAAFELGLLLLQQGDSAAAEQQLRYAVDYGNPPTRLYAHMHLADLYIGPLAQPDQAIAQYEAVLQADMQDTAALIGVSDNLYQELDRPLLALEALRQAKAVQPDNPEVLVRLAVLHAELGNLEAAQAEAQRALALTDTLPVADTPTLASLRSTTLRVLGDVERKQGNLPLAEDLYTQAFTLDPGNVQAVLGLGLVDVARDDWPAALREFEQAVSMPGGTGYDLAHFWLAEALLRLDNVPRAMEAYRTAMLLHGEQPFPPALLGLAQAYAALGNQEAAQETIGEALDHDPDYAEAWLFQGRLLQTAGDYEAAYQAYSRAIRANDQLADAYYYRGLIAMRDEDFERARTDLERAILLAPNNALAHYWLGRANFSLAENRTARTHFQRALDLSDGTLEEALYYRGLAEEQLGLVEAAVNSFQSIINASSQAALVERAQAELQRFEQHTAPFSPANTESTP